MDEGLGAAVDVAARIWVVSGNRPQIDDVALVSLHHAWQYSMRAIKETVDIDSYAALPFI